jgi:hypothetical protein
LHTEHASHLDCSKFAGRGLSNYLLWSIPGLLWFVVAKQLAELVAAVFEPSLATALEGLLEVSRSTFAIPAQDVLCGSVAKPLQKAAAFDDGKQVATLLRLVVSEDLLEHVVVSANDRDRLLRV